MTSPRRPRILVVDDSPIHLHTLSEALHKEYDLAMATSGQRALDIAFSEDAPDLVLLDVLMPEMDGYEVCRRLKADERTLDIPVLFVTTFNETEGELLGLELGAIDYLVKPINPRLVRARVRNHLALRQAGKLREDVEHITRHDLKNPLSVVLSVPRMLSRAENLTPKQLRMLGLVEEAGYAMLRLINFSLDLLRIEQGVYVYEPKPLDLAALCRRVFMELKDLARSMEATLELYIDGRPPERDETLIVPCEDLLCHTMLGNLVRNALEASPPGGVVRVELRGWEPVRITIHNHGEIPPEIQSRFFQKYVTRGKARGTGLGTYSARLTAQVMGGSISYDTSAERGTTVTVEIPSGAEGIRRPPG